MAHTLAGLPLLPGYHCCLLRKTITPLSHRLLNPKEKIGSVYPLIAFDGTRPLAPVLRQKMALSDV
jgi:hypothetical protein